MVDSFAVRSKVSTEPGQLHSGRWNSIMRPSMTTIRHSGCFT